MAGSLVFLLPTIAKTLPPKLIKKIGTIRLKNNLLLVYTAGSDIKVLMFKIALNFYIIEGFLFFYIPKLYLQLMSNLLLKAWNSCVSCTTVNYSAQYCANCGKRNVLFTLIIVID